MNDLPTGRQFHRLIDPRRDIPAEATRIHGFTSIHVQDKPLFAEIAADLLAFFGEDSGLIAHNAAFDFAFLNAELALAGLAALSAERMIDTLALAKTRFPGLPNSLDALCRRFEIDLSARTTHNALLDCKLLADVYVELTGGRQRGLALETRAMAGIAIEYRLDGARVPRLIEPTELQTRRARGVCCPVERSALALRVIFAGLKHRRAAQIPHFRRTHAGTSLAIASAWTSTPPSPVHASTPSFGLST